MVTHRRIESDFRRLAREWRGAIDLAPTVDQMIAHPLYEAIIGLGPSVVPYLLGELVDRPDQWFHALQRITGSDPARGIDTYDAAATAWLTWGDEHRVATRVPRQA